MFCWILTWVSVCDFNSSLYCIQQDAQITRLVGDEYHLEIQLKQQNTIKERWKQRFYQVQDDMSVVDNLLQNFIDAFHNLIGLKNS